MTAKTRAAQVSSLTERPTPELAALRAEIVSAVRRLPMPDERMLMADLEQAGADMASVRSRSDASATPTDLALTESRLELARGRESEGRAALRSIAAGVEHVENIDAALAPRIRSAVESPSNYIIDTLGDRPDHLPERWDAAAKAIETYRHATLGMEPSQGPLSDNPAIGARPSNPIAAESWSASHSAVQVLANQSGIPH